MAAVDNNKPSDWAQASWDKAVKLGVFDGSGPQSPLTSEQYAVLLDRQGLLKLK